MKSSRIIIPRINIRMNSCFLEVLWPWNLHRKQWLFSVTCGAVFLQDLCSLCMTLITSWSGHTWNVLRYWVLQTAHTVRTKVAWVWCFPSGNIWIRLEVLVWGMCVTINKYAIAWLLEIQYREARSPCCSLQGLNLSLSDTVSSVNPWEPRTPTPGSGAPL